MPSPRPGHVCVLRPLARLGLLLAAGVVAAACSATGNASPTAPGTVVEFSVPDLLAPSLALIDSDPRPVPLLGEPAGEWLRREVRGVIIDPSLPANVRAQCCGNDRMIRWSTGWLPNPSDAHDVRVAAAIIVHEARHAQGYLHTCPDRQRDRTFDEGGAWALQSVWLRHMGDEATADSIAALDIGCR